MAQRGNKPAYRAAVLLPQLTVVSALASLCLTTLTLGSYKVSSGNASVCVLGLSDTGVDMCSAHLAVSICSEVISVLVLCLNFKFFAAESNRLLQSLLAFAGTLAWATFAALSSIYLHDPMIHQLPLPSKRMDALVSSLIQCTLYGVMVTVAAAQMQMEDAIGQSLDALESDMETGLLKQAHSPHGTKHKHLCSKPGSGKQKQPHFVMVAGGGQAFTCGNKQQYPAAIAAIKQQWAYHTPAAQNVHHLVPQLRECRPLAKAVPVSSTHPTLKGVLFHHLDSPFAEVQRQQVVGVVAVH